MGPGAPLETAEAFVLGATAGDWDGIRHLVGPDVRLVFPTGEYRSLDDLAVGLAGRYRSIAKRVLSRDVAVREDGSTVVGLGGELHGVNVHGVAFDGVRFFDRVVLDQAGSVREQHVFNDLAVSGVLDRR